MRKQYELPNVDSTLKTIINARRERSTLRPKRTLEPNKTFFQEERGQSRKREERSPYERSPYLDYQPLKKATFYNDKSKPNYYIIKQGRTINFKDFEEARAKSSGRTNAVLERRPDSDSQRELSFMAYGGQDDPYRKSNTSAFPKNKPRVVSERSAEDRGPSKDKSKKNFRRKGFVESTALEEQATGMDEDPEVCLDELSTQQYRTVRVRVTHQDTLSRIKHLSQETDNSLAGSVINYFNVSKPPDKKINSEQIAMNAKASGKNKREEVFHI
jgi:hypothetical protein